MISTVDTLFANSQDRIYAVHGVEATYDGTPITVLIMGYDQRVESYPEVWIAAATVEVRSSEVPAPARGDTVTLDGVTYQVGEIVNRDSLGATLALTRQMVRI